MSAAPQIPIETRNGIYLPEADLWLDPPQRKGFAFVSHAHADHFARHATILCSPTNAKLLAARFGGRREYHALEFGETLERNGHRIELLPAGHALGSAQIHITRIADGTSLLYTGDFKWRPGLSSEAPAAKPADTLIMETTFGLPKYSFPPIETLRAATVEFCKAALAEGKTPLLLGYSFGKAQEILAMLHGETFAVAVHGKVRELTDIYIEVGIRFPPFETYRPDLPADTVLIFPPNAKRPALPPGSTGFRTAMFSGWGIDPSAKYRFRCDEVFPLSDHADYEDSLAFVKAVSPKRVLTTHGYTAPFAADLRRLGYDAWSLEGDDQLEFISSGF